MGDSYRIRTEVGINKTINIQLDQDFEYLEILSLKIQQSEIYDRSCSDYGVLVGRVTANNGLGVPNARLSIFIPISPIDESNPIIQSIYPYKSPSDKNEDGYRYNLLPYEKSYSKHAATGTFPSRNDVLTATTVVELYDNYYKFTAKTNDSGDYMIFGVPLGYQQVVMDVDLSDIGEFSLTPQDLIRMGVATESQVAGDTFKSSNDLNSLPQIINVVKSCVINPLWGDPNLCQIAVNRVDFDLRDDASIDIQPTSVFMGSIFSSTDEFRIKKNSKIKDNMGNLCGLIAGPGQIIAIRQTVAQDPNGNPVLERYQIEDSGNVIQDDGTWLIEIPMNLEYVITDEFGQKKVSNDPTKGIPTKGKYRFKIKWDQPKSVSLSVRRPYYLVPNVKEYGWLTNTDPNIAGNPNQQSLDLLESSYYFGLDWTGYTNGFTGQDLINRSNEIIDCEDTFYEFRFNKVYTVSSLIDQYKYGGRGNFLGIKEIGDNSCADTVNKFPVNEGFRNFDLIYFIFSLLLLVVQTILSYFLIVAHVLTYLYNIIVNAFCWIFPSTCTKINYTIRLPMITYPDCQACECKDTDVLNKYGVSGTNGALSFLSDNTKYTTNLEFVEWPKYPIHTFNQGGGNKYYGEGDAITSWANIVSQAMAGNPYLGFVELGKVTKSDVEPVPQRKGDEILRWFAYSNFLPLGERINKFNLRSNYFRGYNKIKVTFAKESNIGKFHYDNTTTVLSWVKFNAGDLLTTVSPNTTDDINNLVSASTVDGRVTTLYGNLNYVIANNGGVDELLTLGLTGTSVQSAGFISVESAKTQDTNNSAVLYYLPTGTTVTSQKYPMDREYFQVITAITVSEASKIWDPKKNGSFAQTLTDKSTIFVAWNDGEGAGGNYYSRFAYSLSPFENYEDMDDQYITILQRGVDPYSPLFTNEYDISNLFGKNIGDIVFTASTRVNIPIQKITRPSTVSSNVILPSIQGYNQEQMMYPSYFFVPGNDFSGFTTTTVGYYGQLQLGAKLELDGDEYIRSISLPSNLNGVVTVVQNVFFSFVRRLAVKIGQGGQGIFNLLVDYDIQVNNNPNASYNLSNDLSGGALMVMGPLSDDPWNIRDADNFWYTDDLNTSYYSKVNRNVPMKIVDKTRNVMRTDRLPSSDGLNGKSWDSNPALLQQNNNFNFYLIETQSDTDLSGFNFNPGGTGSQQVIPDIIGQAGSTSVFESFSCENMVSLKCYEGFGVDFGVDQNCIGKDNVEFGCYLFLRRPWKDLSTDLKSLNEWATRFRFFYALCRGVLSESFTNNWINGTLYMFPIQVDTIFNSQNQAFSQYARPLIYFTKSSNNFYVRSSPYNINQGFVGRTPIPSTLPVNSKNLLFPTTIVDLGMKSQIYSEILLDPTTKGFLMNDLDSTSYGDTSDLLNFFVISRITSPSVLKSFPALGNNSINQLFSRGPGGASDQSRKRIDGDLAQNLSINSEVGVYKFSPEFYEVNECDANYCLSNSCAYTLRNTGNTVENYFYYDDSGNLVGGQIAIGGADVTICGNQKYGKFLLNNLVIIKVRCCDYSQNPVQILGTSNKPVMAIWFSSNTEDLQARDYLTPGRLSFRSSGNVFIFNYGIKSQVVPFYQWKLKRTIPIFGDEQNNWDTSTGGIFSNYYQSLDRLNTASPTYFQSTTVPTQNTDYRRGYIFSVDQFGNYSQFGARTDKFLVGAPFHFYFGIKKGSSALDHFKTKYLADE